MMFGVQAPTERSDLIWHMKTVANNLAEPRDLISIVITRNYLFQDK
jgi:hypothetical protein